MKAAVSLPANVVQLQGAPSPSHPITLTVSLKHRNLDRLEPLLRAVSDPTSPDYGNYLTASQLNELFGPSPSSLHAVEKWLASAGIPPQAVVVTEGGGAQATVSFATTVGTANDLLQADFTWFDVQGALKLRTREYAIPRHLVEHVDLVAPTTYFGKIRELPPYSVPSRICDTVRNPFGEAVAAVREKLSASDAADDEALEVEEDCAKLITPVCLAEAYSYRNYEPDFSLSGSAVGFASFLNQTARHEDLDLYLKLFGLPPNTFTTESVNRPRAEIEKEEDDPAGPHGEANLDVQLLAAVTRKLPITQYATKGRPPLMPNLRQPDDDANTNEPWIEYFEFLLSRPDEGEALPAVLTHSYGDDEQSVPLEYAVRTCALAGMLGLRGVSVLVASGDSGVGAPCKANDGSGRREFTPIFPATCPFVTAVGGTQGWGAPPRFRFRHREEGSEGEVEDQGEVAWVGSSGGFSFYFEQPWYQRDAVEAYLDDDAEGDGGIDPVTREYFAANGFVDFGGRGFPDVAAHSLSPNYVYVLNGKAGLTGGTSAACPVFAGVVALLNDARARAGQPTMGFLNPWLYGGGYRALRDVVGGRSKGCQGVDIQTGKVVPGAGVIPGASWNATIGWDPATGLGLPDFEAMRKLAVKWYSESDSGRPS